jgi:hypothetical protein
MRMSRLVVVLLLVLGVVGRLHAQSLADLARKEESRRAQIRKPSRVLTNKDLKPSESPRPPVTEAKPDEAAKPADAAAAGKKDEPSDEEKQAKEEETWRKRMADARQALERSQMYLDALQSKINALWTDFTARDDPAQRAQIDTERKKALAEYDRVKAEIELNKKAIEDLEEEARKAGVPAGWLR